MAEAVSTTGAWPSDLLADGSSGEHSEAVSSPSVVQFVHPGGEHAQDEAGRKHWNRGVHQRKFLLTNGEYLSVPNGPPIRDQLVFWGEWEPESEVERIPRRRPGGPRWLHRPYYERPASYPGDLQNTDPFVFGHRFLYTLCRQMKRLHGVSRPTFLRDLAPGSLILFGSLKRGQFVLDTAFVVAAGVLHDAETWPARLDGRISATYADVTIRPTYQTHWLHELRLYSGATEARRVGDMFSFVPCLPASNGVGGFARPAVVLRDVVTPGLMMGAKVTRGLPLADVAALWESVVAQVLEQDLALGIRFDLPRRRES